MKRAGLRALMKSMRRLGFLILGRPGRYPSCYVHLQLTGKPPANDTERLVEGIVGKGKSAPLHWLEEQLCDTLYRAELRRGAGTLDIGVWGPTLFRIEAVRVLKEMRSEFAYPVPDGRAEIETMTQEMLREKSVQNCRHSLR